MIIRCQVLASNENSFERHPDVAKTFRSSKRASELGKDGDLSGTVAGGRLVSPSVSQTVTDLDGFLCTTIS